MHIHGKSKYPLRNNVFNKCYCCHIFSQIQKPTNPTPLVGSHSGRALFAYSQPLTTTRQNVYQVKQLPFSLSPETMQNANTHTHTHTTRPHQMRHAAYYLANAKRIHACMRAFACMQDHTTLLCPVI